MARFSTTLSRSPAGRRTLPRRGRRLSGMLLGLIIATAVTAGGATALLSAIASNDPGQAVTSGKLSIALADNGAGFTQAVSGLLPSDTVTRFVDVTNDGTADATNLTLTVTAGTANKLVTDATNGLQLAIASCSGTWTPGTGSCSGSVTTLVAPTPLSALTGATRTVVGGAFPPGSAARLRMTLSLPNQNEVTTSGTVPANSIQGLSTTLTYTFAVAQRAGTSSSG